MGAWKEAEQACEHGVSTPATEFIDDRWSLLCDDCIDERDQDEFKRAAARDD